MNYFLPGGCNRYFDNLNNVNNLNKQKRTVKFNFIVKNTWSVILPFYLLICCNLSRSAAASELKQRWCISLNSWRWNFRFTGMATITNVTVLSECIGIYRDIFYLKIKIAKHRISEISQSSLYNTILNLLTKRYPTKNHKPFNWTFV